MHAWVARAVRQGACCVLVVQRARLRDVLAVHPPRPLRHRRPAPALPRVRPSWYSSRWPLRARQSSALHIYHGPVYRGGRLRRRARRLRWHADARGSGDVWGNARSRPDEHGLGSWGSTALA